MEYKIEKLDDFKIYLWGDLHRYRGLLLCDKLDSRLKLLLQSLLQSPLYEQLLPLGNKGILR